MSGMEKGPAPRPRYGSHSHGEDKPEIAVRVTAADFNGKDWDGSPFSAMPDWLATAVKGGSITPHTRNSTDYAEWDVVTSKGTISAGPGDWIIRRERGDLSVVDEADAFILINLRAPDNSPSERVS